MLACTQVFSLIISSQCVHQGGSLGSKLHAGPRSAGTLTAAPLIPFCLPLGNVTNFMNRIRLHINV